MTTDLAEELALRQYLTFRLGNEVFAVDVTKAQEVLDFTTVTRVPQTPKYMRGVINLRGSVVPVVDMRIKFGMDESAQTRDTCIIVMEVSVDGERAVIGAVADAVLEVLDLDEEQVEPPPRIGTKLNTEFIKGMGNRNGDFLIMLDIDRVFSSDEIALISGAMEEGEGEVA